jgi:hypothetical protein
MEPLVLRVATRFSSAAVTVYHGTTAANAAKIRREGLISKLGYDRPQWYMVAADFNSAAFHSGNQGEGTEEGSVVIEFKVPTEPKQLDEGKTRNMWPGYPYLWKPTPITWEGKSTKWYALKQPLPPEFIKKVTRVGD